MTLLADQARTERVSTRLREHIELASIIGGPRALPLLVELGDRSDLPGDLRSVLVREVARSRSPQALAVLIDWYAPKYASFVPSRGQLIDAAITVGLEADLSYLTQRAGREADAGQRDLCLSVKSGIEAKLASQRAALAIDRATGSELVEQLSSDSASWVRLRIVKKLGANPSPAAVTALAQCLPRSPQQRLDTVELNALVELVRLAESRDDARLAVAGWARAIDDSAIRSSATSVLAFYGGAALARELGSASTGTVAPWLAAAAVAIQSRLHAASGSHTPR